jgi:hypothetical protein
MAIVNGTTGDDLLTGTSDADTITGDAGADTISGGAGADTINAGDGNDIVSGGKGRDEVYLGSGDDVWLLQDDEVVLNVNYGSWGASSVFDVADGGDGYDKLWLMSSSSEINLDVSNADISGFESLWLIGSGYSDGRKARLTDTQLSSFSDIDARRTSLGEGSFEPSYHTNNLDFFNFPDRSDYDSSRPIGGIIYLTDGNGDELIELDARVFDSFFVSSIIFEGQTEFINGDGHIFAKSSISDDILTGGAGIDVFRGGGGDDQLSGKAGNDVLRGEDGDDLIIGGAGDDWLKGQDGDDTLWGGDGDDQLNGGADTNVLRGEAGADTITLGLGAHDEAYGGADNDTFVIDGAGTGIIDGGTGNDRILVTSFSDISGYTISNVEAIELDAVAELYLTPEQAASIPITESETIISSEVWLKLPETGSFTLNESIYALSNKVIGSSQGDRITGTSSEDVLAGAGGLDVINALGGDDTIVISNDDWDQTDRSRIIYNDDFDNSVYATRLLELDEIDGGAGTDTLEFRYENVNGRDIQTLYLDSSIQNIEKFEVTGLTNSYQNLHQIIFDAEVWRNLDYISVHTPQEDQPAYYPKLFIVGDGGSVDLSNLAPETYIRNIEALGQLTELSLSGFTGSVDQIGLGDFGSVESVIGSEGDDKFNFAYSVG